MELKAYINGKFIDKKEKLEIMNPETGKVAGTVPSLTKEEIDFAFKSARKAYKKWKFYTYKDRIVFMKKFVSLLEENEDRIADAMILEIAKPKSSSLSEVRRTVYYISQTIEEYIEFEENYEIVDSSIHKIEGKEVHLTRESLGVVVAISPFNYPVNLSLAKIAPALLVGNTVIAKSATQGSLSGAIVAELFDKAGFPKGTFNYVTGRGSKIGDVIVEHEEVNMISFTGGERVGIGISEKTSMIPLVLELGGKDAAIVTKNANLDLTVKEIIKGAYSYSGQRCTAIKRVLVDEAIADELSKRLSEEVSKISVGTATKENMVTPLIDEWTAKNTISLMNDAKEKGATILNGGRRKFTLVDPILIDFITEDMKLAWEEPFAPILPIIRFKELGEAIKIHNKSSYGLQGSVFTENDEEFFEIAVQMETGTVNLNRSSSRGPDILPFLGVKNSGFGTQGIKEALLSMSRVKPIIINKIKYKKEKEKNIMIKTNIKNMPKVALGTWEINDPKQVEETIVAALNNGYKHIDTAQFYFNEELIGLSWPKSNVKREDFWITTKIHSLNYKYNTYKSIEKSIEHLNTTFLDTILLHSSCGNEENLIAYKEAMRARDNGLVRFVGVSNFTIEEIEYIKEQTGEYPSDLQIIASVIQRIKKIEIFCKEKGINLMGYSSIRPYYNPNFWYKDSALTKDEIKTIDAISAKHNTTPANILQKYILDAGYVVLPKSSKASRVISNLDLLKVHLDKDDYKKLNSMNKTDYNYYLENTAMFRSMSFTDDLKLKGVRLGNKKNDQEYIKLLMDMRKK
ncbi:MAG: aldehyde dehydrogenase family protein [Mollicutes bacterium PWAP]|nr:aldehyde dehydrogenase family protein [Mollicutes bacterium PWAP]